MTRAIMFQGTGSDVGKTVLVAALCRAAWRRGLRVYPFKPQNMSNNAAVADDGGEIGRGQWLQALAAKVPPSVHMNPVLLKPQSETGSQIIVHGKVRGKASGRDYQTLKRDLLDAVMCSFRKISEKADLVLVEGAGSPAEINLRAGDIANMGFAREADIPVILIGDIDRGGVIASLVGTHTILSAEDRALIEGFIINKFRGDPNLFEDGINAIRHFTGWPSFGVVPWCDEARLLPAEDSVILQDLQNSKKADIKIAVPVLSHIANFDDLDPLIHEEGVEVVFVRKGETMPNDATLIILLGSKSTISAMKELRQNGWEEPILRHATAGKTIIGLCGGYQMLGTTISDPHGLEGESMEIAGLGLLDVATIMKADKTVRNVKAFSPLYDATLEGYEIHIGLTTGGDCAHAPMVVNSEAEGASIESGKIWGSYLHGIFENGVFRRKFLHSIGAVSSGKSHLEQIDELLDRLAKQLEDSLDIDALFALAR